jgi:DNA helicase HerA-like ATPase
LVFETLDGKFTARLREIASTTRTTAEGAATVTFRTARVEAEYHPDVIKKLNAGQLLAVPNVMGVGSNDCCSVYEIADVTPMHYSMLTLDRSQPSAIRKEFMSLIDDEWTGESNSTWIEIVAAPTGYIMKTDSGSLEFERKHIPVLTGSQVQLLDREAVHHRLGNLLGFLDNDLPFTVDIEKLIHYHVGVFAFTGSGKSNLTSMTIRKALRLLPHLKVVILDVSSEYGIHLLDILEQLRSRVTFPDELKQGERAEDYLRRHAIPETLLPLKDQMIGKISKLIDDEKVSRLSVPFVENADLQRYTTYGGIIESLKNILDDKYGPTQQKLLVPEAIAKIEAFLRANRLDAETEFGAEAGPLLVELIELVGRLGLRSDAKILKTLEAVQLVIETRTETTDTGDEYTWDSLIDEILDPSEDSPRIFVVNLPEVEDARFQTAEMVRKIFRRRKASFTLKPRVLFLFDEAQEFIPYERKRDDGTDASSKAVERLLRHGRKYHLHGWISTQRIAHLNTNALQQLHSYFVSTMPRPYDRHLISDSFAIDDAFIERTLMFQNGDWLLTSFKATSSQNVPVFFHAENNEEVIKEYLA